MLSNPYEALEFDKVVGVVRRFAVSPYGAAALQRLLDSPRLPSREVADAELSIVEEAVAWLRAAELGEEGEALPVPQFDGLEDVSDPIQTLAKEGGVLDAPQIRHILDLVDAAQRYRLVLLNGRDLRPGLYGYGERVPDLRTLLGELSGKILPSDEVSSLASTALSRIRRQVEKQRQLVETSLQRFVRKHADSGALQDNYVTMRNGRTVVPVKAEWKAHVDGIVHGTSSSGHTVFVEPLDTIVQNNRLVRLREDEQAEILRILREISGRLRSERAALVTIVRAVEELESVFARARFGRDFRCCRPRFCDPTAGAVVLEEARHPLLQDLLASKGASPVPLSVRLEHNRRTMIVSGPNAGGKTVVLKTVGVLAAMAQAGIPVPAERAEFPWFDRILADIGDAQSISESLSTFSAHVAKLTAIIENATGGSLAILDELGTATDPEDGGALAIAVVERLCEAGGFAVVSTHLPELKMYGAGADGIVSASMGFDDESLGVTYRLRSGVPGQSAGLEMAQRFGMPVDVIRRAHQLKGHAGERVASFLADLRRQAAEYERLADEARTRNRKLDERARQIEDEAVEQASALRRETDRKVEELVQRIERRFQSALDSAVRKLRTGSARQDRPVQRKAAQALSGFQRSVRSDVASTVGVAAAGKLGQPNDEFAVGDRVRVHALGASGEIVRKLDGGRWEVQSGPMRLRVLTNEIKIVDEPEPSRPRLPEGVSLKTATGVDDVPSEINVIGKSADEALIDVDRFLDRAVLANRTRLRVIHGFGKDVLRRQLWQMFARHMHVAKYYQAEQQDGGAGVTIVEVSDR